MSMASQVIREWMGIQQFPPATQKELLELLGKLKQEVIIFFPFFTEFECNPSRYSTCFSQSLHYIWTFIVLIMYIFITI